jgi:hypothetical protein
MPNPGVVKAEMCWSPNRTLKLDFLNTRNIIILALYVFVFKFVHLATIVLVPVGGGLLSTDDAAP